MGGQFPYRLVGLGGYPLLGGECVDAVDVGIGLGYFASIRSLALKSFQRSTLGTQYRLEVIFHSLPSSCLLSERIYSERRKRLWPILMRRFHLNSSPPSSAHNQLTFSTAWREWPQRATRTFSACPNHGRTASGTRTFEPSRAFESLKCEVCANCYAPVL